MLKGGQGGQTFKNCILCCCFIFFIGVAGLCVCFVCVASVVVCYFVVGVEILFLFKKKKKKKKKVIIGCRLC